ncbi:MAG: hypothetical protein JWQ40_4723 [Segetibacter sp.]|nr:hypothetical protein [Segetibacter sp.]
MIKEWMETQLTNYINQYGRQECGKIMQTLNDSNLFNENLEIALRHGHVPNSKQLNTIISSCSYKLAFAKQRKVNFAALYFLIVLYRKCEEEHIPINENAFTYSAQSVMSS